jgi:hypothetical protein
MAIQKPQVERNVECDPFLLWIAELDCDPKKPDRSQAWVGEMRSETNSIF